MVIAKKVYQEMLSYLVGICSLLYCIVHTVSVNLYCCGTRFYIGKKTEAFQKDQTMAHLVQNSNFLEDFGLKI